MSDNILHAESLFGEKLKESEFRKMAEFYLVFHRQLEHYLRLSKLSSDEREKIERNCKGVYDRAVRKIVGEGKSPYYKDFSEFLETFKDMIISNSFFTSQLSLDIIKLMEHSHDSLE